MARIAVIGCGYVGSVTAACLAELGHDVLCIDTDPLKVERLKSGQSPIFEPGLDALLSQGIAAERLSFASSYPDLLDVDFVFLAVNTPGGQNGAADLRAVRDAVTSVARRVANDVIIVNKSTVPIGTGDLVEGMALRSGAAVHVVSNPEFLREGTAVDDFFHPDRVVLGSNNLEAARAVACLYEAIDAEVLVVDIRTAEMIKYASNAFLATKISFINEIAAICEVVGADVDEVANGMGMDRRIGSAFLKAGLGWGGSCFPKDVRALAHIAGTHGTHAALLRTVMDINDHQRVRTVRKLRDRLGGLEGARLVVLGAAFKPNTDDTRNSPALELAEMLVLEGCDVGVYDPVVPADRIIQAVPGVTVVTDLCTSARGVDALIVATEWPEFAELPLRELAMSMRTPLLFDARNFLQPTDVVDAGLDYLSLGRAPAQAGEQLPDSSDSLVVGANL